MNEGHSFPNQKQPLCFILTHSINVLFISKCVPFLHICTYLYIPPVYISGRYFVTYFPFGTPIPHVFFVLFFAPQEVDPVYLITQPPWLAGFQLGLPSERQWKGFGG